MRYSVLTIVLPCALLLISCTTVEPAFNDAGAHVGTCVEGGPDNVTQQFYDYRIEHLDANWSSLRPYLSDDLSKMLTAASRDTPNNVLLKGNPFSSRNLAPEKADVASASTILNSGKRNISLGGR